MLSEVNTCITVLEWGLPSSEHTNGNLRGDALANRPHGGPMSRLIGHVEDIESRESNVDVGSRVGECLLGYGLDSGKKSS